MRQLGRHPAEVRERAVRLVAEYQHEYPSQWPAITYRTRFGVEPICRVLQFAPSPITLPPSVGLQSGNSGMSSCPPEIQRIHRTHLGIYGTRKVWRQLLREGIAVARYTVERLMRKLGLCGGYEAGGRPR